MIDNMTYPQTVELGGEQFLLRRVEEKDAEHIQALTLKLPQQDLIYVNRDLTKLPVINAWIRKATNGDFETLILERDGKVVGMSALAVDKLSWSGHVGEIRVIVDNTVRRQGAGRLLVAHTFFLALQQGLRKITAQMTVDQKGAISVFEEMGFTGEALLKDHVMDADGVFHDLVILSCDVEVATNSLMMSA